MDFLPVCARRISGLHLFRGAACFDIIRKIFMLNNKRPAMAGKERIYGDAGCDHGNYH